MRVNYTIIFVRAEFHNRMVERDVPCIQEPKEIFGARIAQYMDPDGLVISVGEEKRGS